MPSSEMSCFSKLDMVAVARGLCSLTVLINSLLVLCVRQSLVLCRPMYDLTYNVGSSSSSRVSKWTSTLISGCPCFVPFVSLYRWKLIVGPVSVTSLGFELQMLYWPM